MFHYHCWNFRYPIAIISFDSLCLPWPSGTKCNPDYSFSQEESGLLQLTVWSVQRSTLLQTSALLAQRSNQVLLVGVVGPISLPSLHLMQNFHLLQEETYLIYQSVACVKGTLPWSPGDYLCIQPNSTLSLFCSRASHYRLQRKMHLISLVPLHMVSPYRHPNKLTLYPVVNVFLYYQAVSPLLQRLKCDKWC